MKYLLVVLFLNLHVPGDFSMEHKKTATLAECRTWQEMYAEMDRDARSLRIESSCWKLEERSDE